jgi:hypothetical protein
MLCGMETQVLAITVNSEIFTITFEIRIFHTTRALCHRLEKCNFLKLAKFSLSVRLARFPRLDRIFDLAQGSIKDVTA